MVAERLDYLRSIGDTQGMLITLMQLSGDCPAKRARRLDHGTTVEAPAPIEAH
jgi:hypothetical protein